MSEAQRQPCKYDATIVEFQRSHDSSEEAVVQEGYRLKASGFLPSLFAVACQRRSWNPARIAGELWRLLSNICTQHRIGKLLRLEPFPKVTQLNPRIAFKYLTPYYLAWGLTTTERASCFLHHYRRLHTAIPESILREILMADITLHEARGGGSTISVTLGTVHRPLDKDMEGELSLDLRVDGEKVFNLSFTIVPGWVVKVADAEVLFVTRLQGVKGRQEQIKLASKVLKCGTASTTMLTALQGIGLSLGISGMTAVCAENQACYRMEQEAIFKKAYDDVFIELGMVKNQSGFFCASASLEERVPKSRAKEKQALKYAIWLTCTKFVMKSTNPPVHPPEEKQSGWFATGVDSAQKMAPSRSAPDILSRPDSLHS